jgi:hypothetical protein
MLRDNRKYLSFNSIIDSDHSITLAISGESTCGTTGIEVENIICNSISANVGMSIENSIYFIAIKT